LFLGVKEKNGDLLSPLSHCEVWGGLFLLVKMTIDEARTISKGRLDNYSDEVVASMIDVLGQFADMIIDRQMSVTNRREMDNNKMRMQYEPKQETSCHTS